MKLTIYPVLSHYDSDSSKYHRMEVKNVQKLNFGKKIKDYYCFDWNNFRLGGSWDDSELYYFSFALFLCDENGTNCADRDEQMI